MNGPDPRNPHPMEGQPRVGFLNALVDRPNIEIGDYTYYDDPDDPEHFANKCVLYHYDFVGDRLIIGRFCALAMNVQFIMNGANHVTRGFSTYPFQIFGNGWQTMFDPTAYQSTYRGDTVVGNDVWIGMSATIMPGVTIGDGAIVAARSMVTGDVAPYAVVGGNPAREVRKRYDQATIADLLAIAWWDWPADKITRNLPAIAGTDLAALKAAT